MSELHDAEKERTIKPASQALLDLEASGLTHEDMTAAVRDAAEEAERKSRPIPPAALPCFHWLVLLLLSAGGSAALAWSGQEAPANLRLWGLAGFILLLLLMSAIPKARLALRLPTRGGLAAALFSIAIFIQTLRGQPEVFFQAHSKALAWAGLLTLAVLWAVVALVRKLGRHALTALGGGVLIYAAVGPVTAMIGHFSPGGPELIWETLNSSPAFLTSSLPWPIWPMALLLGLTLPLATILSLGDLWSSLRRPGARHGGSFFLALAWLGLIPSGLLLFTPMADNYPDMVKKVRGLAPVMAGVESTPTNLPSLPLESLQDASEPSAPTTMAEPSEPLPAPVAPTPELLDSESQPPTTPDASASRLEDMQLRIDDLEGQLQILSDRLNQLEKPEQPHNLTSPLPPDLEAPKTPTTPDQPLNAQPEVNGQENEWETYYYGGSAT